MSAPQVQRDRGDARHVQPHLVIEVPRRRHDHLIALPGQRRHDRAERLVAPWVIATLVPVRAHHRRRKTAPPRHRADRCCPGRAVQMRLGSVQGRLGDGPAQPFGRRIDGGGLADIDQGSSTEKLTPLSQRRASITGGQRSRQGRGSAGACQSSFHSAKVGQVRRQRQVQRRRGIAGARSIGRSSDGAIRGNPSCAARIAGCGAGAGHRHRVSPRRSGLAHRRPCRARVAPASGPWAAGWGASCHSSRGPVHPGVRAPRRAWPHRAGWPHWRGQCRRDVAPASEFGPIGMPIDSASAPGGASGNASDSPASARTPTSPPVRRPRQKSPCHPCPVRAVRPPGLDPRWRFGPSIADAFSGGNRPPSSGRKVHR